MGTENEFACYAMPEGANLSEVRSIDQELGLFVVRNYIASNHSRGPATDCFTSAGGRFYADHGHAEYCTPECQDAATATIHDIYGERFAVSAFVKAIAIGKETMDWPDGIRFEISKKSTGQLTEEYRGELTVISRGMHENYQALRQGMEIAENNPRVVRSLAAHNISRLVYTGAGGFIDGEYWISPRAYAMKRLLGDSTEYNRPVVNMRNETLLRATDTYQRIHNISSEGNVSPWQTHVKLGTTNLIISYLEDGGSLEDLCPGDSSDEAVEAMHKVGLDDSLKAKLSLPDGKSMSAIEIQREILRRVKPYAVTEDQQLVAEEWDIMLGALEGYRDKKRVTKPLMSLDWFAKTLLFQKSNSRRGTPEKIDAEYAMMMDSRNRIGHGYRLRDMDYFRLTPEEAFLTEDALTPASRRAVIRGRIVSSPLYLKRSDYGTAFVNWERYRVLWKDGYLPDNPTESDIEKFDSMMTGLERAMGLTVEAVSS
jgi:proteasome accessory factor A